MRRWDVPRPVQFDSDVRKRVITVEANKLEPINPIQADGIEGRRPIPLAVGTPPPTVSQNGRTEKGEKDRPFTVADLTATSGGAPKQHTRVASRVENNR